MKIELPRQTLIISRDMMGDLVNTTGAVRCLREAFPQVDFTIEGGGAACDLFWDLPVLFRPRRGGLPAKIRRVLRLRRLRVEAAVIFDDGHQHARITRLAGIRSVYGVHRGKPELFTNSVAFDPEGHDLFDSEVALLRLLGVSAPDVRPSIRLQPEDQARGERLFEELGRPEILLHVGASDYRKNWPDESWLGLIERSKGRRVAAIAGPGEDATRFGVPCPASAPALREYAVLLGHVHRLVTPDTGAAHLAAAMGTATTVLYGPTDPKRFHPWNNGNQALIRKEDRCAHYGHGCAFAKEGRCPQTCMRAISPEDVPVG